MVSAQEYNTNNIFISTNHPFTWKSEVRERIDALTDVNQFIVSAPHGTGMTDFAETISYDFAEASNDVLLVTASEMDADRTAFGIRILKKCELRNEGDRYLIMTSRGTITIPRNTEALNDILVNDDDINVIVADGCEAYSNEKLHNIALKGSLVGSVSIFLGAEEEFGKTYLNKSVWKWFLNHPSFDVNRVIAADSIKGKGLDKTLCDTICGLFSAGKFRYTGATCVA